MEEKSRNMTDEHLSRQLRKSKSGKLGGKLLSLVGGVVAIAGIILGGNIVLLFAEYTEEQVKKAVADMLKRCNFQKEQCYVGIGRCNLNAQNIGKSYRQACQVLKLQKNIQNTDLLQLLPSVLQT